MNLCTVSTLNARARACSRVFTCLVRGCISIELYDAHYARLNRVAEATPP